MATEPARARAWRTNRWSLGVVVMLYLVLGVLIALQARPQQLWACPDASTPSGAVLYAQPPRADCEPTVSRQEEAESVATTTLLGPVWMVVKTLYGKD